MKIKAAILFTILLLLPVFGMASSFSTYNQNLINEDTSKVTYEINCMVSWGGDSKLALIFPKVNILRKHNLKVANIYYGGGLGLHLALISGYGSISGITGIEKSIFNLESSISHFRTTKIPDGNGGLRGSFSQNLVSLKFGLKIKRVRLNLVRSFILSEKIPLGQDRIPLLDIGNINNKIWGIEIQLVTEE